MNNYIDLPVYQKGEELVELTQAIVASFEEDKDQFDIGQMMLENVFLITAKIANAEGGDFYSHRMENAMLIKIACKELLAQASLSRKLELTDKGYLFLLQNEIENFRMVFLDWVHNFDESNDVIDDWNFLYK